MTGRTAGWYADPVTVGAARYWDGRGWTDLVSWGGTNRHDPTPQCEVERREAIAEAAVVSEYLTDAAQRDVITPSVAGMLRLDVEQRVSGGITPPPPALRTARRTQTATTTPESIVADKAAVEPQEPITNGLPTANVRATRHPHVVVEIPADADSVVVRSRVQQALVDAHENTASEDYTRSTHDVRDDFEALITETAGWVDLRGESVTRVLGSPRQTTPSSIAAGWAAPAARAEAPASSTAPAPRLDPVRVRSVPLAFGRLGHWWDEARHAVRSELALHGLAYLGVLLLFAGVTGLITFSFGDVAPWVRALAELMVPTALFVSAWYLQRRGASVVGASLTLLGGAITPIVAAASFTDGSPFPPDLSGRSLAIIQGAAVAGVGIAMWFVVRRSPSSPLRFIVGPALWMAAGLAAAVGRDPIPVGYDTARPDSLQLAVILAAVTATVLLCSWHRVPATLADSTRLVALPTAGVVYILEIVLAADQDWPLASTIVVGLGSLLMLELSSKRIPAAITSGLQLAVVAVLAARLSAKAAPEWVAMGAAIVLLALVEYLGRRRPVNGVTLAGLTLSGSAFLLTLSDAPVAAAAFGALTVWGLWRHVLPADWLPISDAFGIVPAAAAVVATAALWDLSERGPALIVTAAVVLAIAVAGRLWRPVAEDALWRWFAPAAAGAVSVASMALPWGELPFEVAASSAMAAAAIALSALPIAARAWTTSAVVVWSLANGAEWVGVSRDLQAVTLATIALALLLGSLVAARPICAQLATIGHFAGLGALAVPLWPGWAAASVVGLATVGWWGTTIVDERSEAVHLAALRVSAAGGADASDEPPPEAEQLLDDGAPLVSLLGLWATVFLTVDAAGWVARDDPWTNAVSGGAFLFAACLVRVTPWRRARRVVLAWATFIGGVAAAVVATVAVGSDRGHWSPVVALALGLAVVGVTAAPRPLGFTWTAWVGGAAITVFIADRLGLDRDWTDVALAGWGAAALLVGLGVHRARYGPLLTGTFVHDRLLLPPAVIGATAFVGGGALGLSAGSEIGIGWTAAGMSAVVLAAAMLLPLGALVAMSQALATAAYVLLAPWEPLDRPWTFVPWVLLLLSASLATRQSGDWSPARWDLPSFLVAHGIAGIALIAAVDSGTVVATYAGFGAVAVAVAVVLWRWPWAAAGSILVLVAGLDAGHGWLALVLAIEGVALTVVGLMRTQIVRWALLTAGAGAIIGAWFDLAAWQSWATPTVFYVTVPAGAAVALAAAAGLRSGREPRELAGVWTIVGSLVVVGTAGFGLDEVARRPGGLILAGSLLTLAVAAALTAVVVGGTMRWVAAALAATAWAPAAWALNVSDTFATLTGTAVALAGLTTAFVAHRRRPDALWLYPGVLYASVTQLAAAIVALTALPDRDLLIVVLLAVSAELVVFGAIVRRSELYLLSPVPTWGAWLLYAADALAGDTNWWAFYATMPAGAVVVGLVAAGMRWVRVPWQLAAGWAITGSLVVVGTAAVGLDEVARLPGGLIFAGSLLTLAVAAALTAVVVGGTMRWVAAALAATAWAPAAWALNVSDTFATLTGTAVALAGLTASLAVHGRQPSATWLHPGAVYASATQIAAAIVALTALPDRDLLIVVLLALSAELVAIGVLSRRSGLYVLSPVPACGAWLLYAADALAGEANWFTVPIGLTLLVMVSLVRWIRRGRGGDSAAYDVIALEFVGMSFLVASALARTLAGHLWNGVLAIGIGVLVAGWGVLTRVRRRAGFGVASVVLATVLLIGVPLSKSVTWQGPALWLTLSVIGIAAIAVAAALERGRERVGHIVQRVDQMTAGWERIQLGEQRDDDADSAQAAGETGSDDVPTTSTRSPANDTTRDRVP